ncbi:uncharacterized protein HMPREF1541_02406 [Cyphellophora europaea CBS 101466]|uniref:Uncharacterized protein n=1 Tax=Cyphellophora europaea (strain CBS 101466) TaxID=1220924 RepID=W2S3I2_CYPE1|nr:uncharacterized protein HMPREF1541_02406 [Cyphellophora europaea CBS 101466]ETN43247.1 hypothetical protein HMPREF1541_02406 [Cyphellophora europaea CBS 101466]
MPDRSRSVEVGHRMSGYVDDQQQDEPSSSAIPSYMRELAASRVNRHSRASSVVSTATKLSTNTFGDDARSIDLMVGGQYFRIARDGSRITDTAPPPYEGYLDAESGSVLSPTFREVSPSISEFSDQTVSTPRRLHNARYYISSNDDEDETAEEGTMTPRQPSPIRTPSTTLRADILDPAQLDMPSPVDTDHSRPTTALAVDDGDAPVRNLSYKQGPEILSVAHDLRKLRSTESQVASYDSTQALRMPLPLRRRNGVRLPSLDTQLQQSAGPGPSRNPGGAVSKGKSQSAGPVLYESHENNDPGSPDFIGSGAAGIFPRFPRTRELTVVTRAAENAEQGEMHESPKPLPMDNENDISLHYAGMMRRLDQDHRREMLFKEREVTHLRQRLVEMDTVYRQELRARDFIIDDLRVRLQSVEEQTETRIEKARNSVEDLWETRWADQVMHLRERMRRIEEESQKSIERLLAERRRPLDEADQDEDHVS